ERACVDARAFRIVAREEARIDDDTVNVPRETEADDRPVVAGLAPTTRFPAVHPFPAFVVDALAPFRRSRFDHPFFRGKELVVRNHDGASESLAGEIRKFRELECGIAHGWRGWVQMPKTCLPPTNVERTTP